MERFAALLVASACTLLVLHGRRAGERARLLRRIAELDAALAQSRLHEHRSRISPHLLLNALNSVAVLAEEEQAPRVLEATARLAQLLRVALEQNTPLTPLRQELAFVERYAAVERVRFGDRLRLTWQIADDCLDANVPALLLQPLVENALRHGVTPGAGIADVTVGAVRSGARLRLWVRDRGPGISGAASGNGRGIRIMRHQLELLFGSDFSFDIASAAAEGAVVTLTIPLMIANGVKHHDDQNAARR